MKNTINYKEILILLAFVAAILVFPSLVQWLNGLVYSLWDVQPGILVSNIIYLLPNLVILGISFWFIRLDGWSSEDIGATLRKILPGFLFAILSLLGLYIILPLGTALFFEPRSLYITVQPFSINYLVEFLSNWAVAGICVAFMTWGYMLNKTHSVLPKKMNGTLKQMLSVFIASLFFTLIHILRFQIANNQMVSIGALLFVFFYCVFCSYLYIRTKNLYVAAFMQAAYAFPPLGLTVGGKLVTKSVSFVFVSALVLLFIYLIASTYEYWGKLLEFSKEEAGESS